MGLRMASIPRAMLVLAQVPHHKSHILAHHPGLRGIFTIESHDYIHTPYMHSTDWLKVSPNCDPNPISVWQFALELCSAGVRVVL